MNYFLIIIIKCLVKYMFWEVPIPNILKIPHHGSKYSLGVTSLFEEELSFDIAIITAKSSSELPKQEVFIFLERN